jgi:cytosine deaminase
MQLEGYGIAPGSNVDFVILDCHSPFDAIRLRPARLYVIRRGEVISKTARSKPTVFTDGASKEIEFVPSGNAAG